ncbi:prepilin-type N-terminal cleavage/methylation domain-containing protein [Paucibacter sp. APW11]|uniref:Prepilin-type N-terminal cleavage/methylation domain-containing protein n=1 Tax=Roseateles aquae TaxID=3077235 RepID=A0ABU3P4Z2_9BURK|nr:prepilin-type N-terminal cleavage/methylation domain-containing protein [Paucibacter sp. APW11]MDT8997655.1 prepilin-type N-terminal cleavage/methylation domain-containing protein [Paucibacter sp. APW11]
MKRLSRSRWGFTIIELLVVLAAIGLLLSVAAPRYIQHLDHARDVALRHDLQALRLAIDQFHADQGRYPKALDELVVQHYLRALPIDPITGRADSWVLIQAQARTDVASGLQAGTGIRDVRSGAPGRGSDGTAYAQW